MEEIKKRGRKTDIEQYKDYLKNTNQTVNLDNFDSYTPVQQKNQPKFGKRV